MSLLALTAPALTVNGFPAVRSAAVLPKCNTPRFSTYSCGSSKHPGMIYA